MQKKSIPQVFIAHAIAAKVDERFLGVQVKRHPQGGWTQAEPASPSSCASIYRGHFGTKEAAAVALLQRKRAYAAELMRGTVTKPANSQLLLLSIEQ